MHQPTPDQSGSGSGWLGKPYICGRRLYPSAAKPVLSRVRASATAGIAATPALAALAVSSQGYYNDFLYLLTV
jgi:hypothetical protein